ncbi:hypothetical protein DTO166G4_2462 [Paecilomyces variotii]|uniref:Fructosyl amine: oxygen oxidoreductase n=1 Tax=Byssochlamys spectabilis TaxID=264951 RepID=A0A443HMN7_BYSSP|nr:fructosyl amine: oxygen oxidoreductase [Paecilomyces variotii]KAJ9215918.1 hypothetical protein DTO166G4_2462 [Paecilomyces variotii]KAJ9237349.1 hypothetical protein DTO169E5_5245 [Paecilomyces variotii]KAJ9348561.1 hypothetical protein DTO027B9_8200 [Paecilomyces variotii]KAJ9353652.1 hypothetical protein DTO280E4_7245 [Paecilomyces variotii]KAJ9393090.1 hypothetical protein DTO063F5_227 [Paecilomyces variotii]
MSIPQSSAIIIVGAGTWGTSTALHLARQGYKNVTLFDRYPVPSPISAGNDVNKVVSPGQYSVDQDRVDVNTALTMEAMRAWMTDPLFKPYYHDTGLLMSATTPAGMQRLGVRVRPGEEDNIVPIDRPEDFRKLAPPGVLRGEFPGWKGYLTRKGAGWAQARNALAAAAQEAQRLGVKILAGGSAGQVVTLIFEYNDVKGVVTADGKIHRAERTILCAGAAAGQFIDFQGQLRPTAWTIAHIALSPEERKQYQNIPVIFNIEKGFFFEPDEDGEIKLCDEHPGYTNMTRLPDGELASVPFEKTQIPKESEGRIRALLRETMPQLADRSFSFARICWCADTANREFIIDRHPKYRSLVLGCGASGRGFKYLPTIGRTIIDAMQDNIPPKMHECLKWNPGVAASRNWADTLGRFGGPNKVMDFANVSEWTAVPQRDLSKL